MRSWPLLIALVVGVPALACGGAPASPRTAAATTSKPGGAAAKAAANAAKASVTASKPEAGPEALPEAYTYQVGGRRDPFLNLLNSGTAVDPRDTAKRGDGAAGLTVNEIVVRGLVQINGRIVAMIQGPDGHNYNIHQGDKLADGRVKTITREGLVIEQVVNDPLSTAKQREVRKLLRSLEEAKQ
jgi:Tfp pilus assembly protein PilP